MTARRTERAAGRPRRLKRAAFTVALLFVLFAAACSPPKQGGTVNSGGYVSAFELTHRFNLRAEPDAVRGVFRFTGDVELTVLAGSPSAVLNGERVAFRSPVLFRNGDVWLPAEAVGMIERAIARSRIYTYSERPFSFRPSTPPPTSRPPATRRPSRRPGVRGTVVLDPGHGGNDSGAVGPRTGVKEKDLNLSVAKRVRSLLAAAGVRVVMTRTADVYVGLRARVAKANAAGADCFVSIHHNAASSPRTKGFEVFYSSNNPFGSLRLKRSVRLARDIERRLRGKWNTRDRGARHKSLYVTRRTRIPSVLVEVEFMTSSEMEPLLTSAWFQQRAAAGIAEGILDYLRGR
ncbi:MAG: hypothetical protein DRP90_00025 [Planctomycetota bacterium]|nr:MAG: hypothetical protein DRP90_00025 [Planctomycetota bacterium]